MLWKDLMNRLKGQTYHEIMRFTKALRRMLTPPLIIKIMENWENLKICWFGEAKERFWNQIRSKSFLHPFFPLARFSRGTSSRMYTSANIGWFTLNFHGGIKTHLHCKYYIEQEQINHICFLLCSVLERSIFLYTCRMFRVESRVEVKGNFWNSSFVWKEIHRAIVLWRRKLYKMKICNEWLWRMVGKFSFFFLFFSSFIQQ